MDFKEIQELIKLINKSNLTEFKMKDGDFKLSIRTKKYGRNALAQLKQQPQQHVVPIQTTPINPIQQIVPQAPPAEAVSNNDDKGTKEPEAVEENFINIKSPIVGTFYRSASPDKDAFVKVGDVVEVGDVVCIVEAMKLFNEIESEVSGTIVDVLLQNESPVEYDQPLFKVKPHG